MSNFLARLVERARGTAPRVEPLVAPRFAPTPIVEITSEVESPSPTRSHQQRIVGEKPSPGSIVQQAPTVEKAASNTFRESEKSSISPQPEKLLVPAESSAVNLIAVVRPSAADDRLVPPVKNGKVKRDFFATSPPKPMGRSISPAKTSRNLERNSLKPNESQEQPPIVRVTIGRIDVRAMPPAVPSRKSSTRSEPKLTLDAYLKSRREGAR